MPETEFFNSSLRAVAFRISAHYDKQNRHEIEEWKRIRWQTSILLNIQLAQKDRITPEKLLPLPGDEKKPAAAPKPTPHEYAKFLIDQFNR